MLISRYMNNLTSKNGGEEGKALLTVECQLINAVGMTEVAKSLTI